jgi:uncharacterized delta-60 repeat protein
MNWTHRCLPAAALGAVLAISAAPASAAPGDPVNQANFDLREVALQSGKTIMAGTADNSDLALIRLNANGDPDASFDVEGFVRADFGANEQAADLALTPGGRILVVGTQSPGATPVAVLAGFNSDGSPDTSFSGDGKATLPLAANDLVSSVDVSSTGRIAVGVIAGNGNFKVIVFTAAGAPDGGFGAGGIATSDVGDTDQTTAVAFQSTGKVVVAGGTLKNTDDFAVVRFGVNGAIDNAADADPGIRFGACLCGTEEIDASSGGPDRVLGMAIDSTDRIVLTGTTGLNVGFGLPNSGTVRLSANGVWETTFATDGKAEFPEGFFQHFAEDVAVAGTGAIVVAGIGYEAQGLGHVQKLSDSGAETFASTNTGAALPTYDTLSSMRVAAASDGGFTLSGGATEYPSGIPGAFAHRFTSGNAFDPAFSGDGVTFPRFAELAAPVTEPPATQPQNGAPGAAKKCKKRKKGKKRRCKRRKKKGR